MKKLLLLAFASILSIGVFAQIKPQPTTLPVNVGVELSDNIMITKISDVYFGGVYIPINSEAIISMDGTGFVSVTSGSTPLYNQSSQRLGAIKIQANSEDLFKITAPASLNLNITSEETAAPLVYIPKFYSMDNALIDISAPSLRYAASMYSTISIGGNLTVPTTARRGLYSGVMNVTITWL